MGIDLDKLSSELNTNSPLIIAGPCSAESQQQLLLTANALKEIGIKIFRAGIWKPRTRPNSFEGVGDIGLEWLRNVKSETNMKIMTEVANPNHLDDILKNDIDMIWIGARTTGNPFAVQEIANALKGVDIPVFVKNPLNEDLNLWIGAIERFHNSDIKQILAIHRGFFAYGSQKYRNIPQWQIPVELKRIMPSIPLLCDPSHIAGHRSLVKEVSQTAFDLNFDGLMIESHINPSEALSDKEQQLPTNELKKLLSNLILRENNISDNDVAVSLKGLRSQIDSLDLDLIEILIKRMNIAQKIGLKKKDNGITILQPERWEYILKDRVLNGKKGGLSNEFLILLLRAIHQESINIQTDIMNRNL
jgi:chorismate mutase